jgi:polyisoprenoid-binding protein YceI
MKYSILFLLAAWPLISADLPGQNRYELSKGYAVSIHGTMSNHNWVETIGDVTGEVTAGQHSGGGVDLSIVRIVMEVRSIKGDMGAVMDSKTYKALKANAHPEITFLLGATVAVIPVKGKEQAVALVGVLTLAGVTRPATLWITHFSLARDSMRFEGKETIDMKDFGVKPPSALFGTLKAGSAITIFFKTVFIIQKNQPTAADD